MNFVEALTACFAALALTMPRMLACFTVFNLLPKQMVPMRVRLALFTLLSLFMLPALWPSLEDVPKLSPSTLLVVAKEGFIGMAIGMMFAPMLWTFHAVGDLIDVQSGASTGTIFDPISNTQAGPFSVLLQNFAIVIVFASGLWLGVLEVLFRSYRTWPIDTWFPVIGPRLYEWIVASSAALLSNIIGIAAPFLSVLLVVEVGLGLVGRSMPSLNIFTYSMPLKFWLSLVIMVLVLPHMAQDAVMHVDTIPTLLRTLTRALGH